MSNIVIHLNEWQVEALFGDVSKRMFNFYVCKSLTHHVHNPGPQRPKPIIKCYKHRQFFLGVSPDKVIKNSYLLNSYCSFFLLCYSLNPLVERYAYGGWGRQAPQPPII